MDDNEFTCDDTPDFEGIGMLIASVAKTLIMLTIGALLLLAFA